MVEIVIHTGNEAPHVVDAVDAVVGCLEKDWQMASERRTRSLLEGCPLMGRKSTWAAARAEVIALGVMVAGSGVRGVLPFLKTRNVY
jgi:hypothetical protein